MSDQTRWSKTTIKFLRTDPPLPAEIEQWPGYLSGNIGICYRKYNQEYLITHQPSGLGIGSAPLLRDAKKLVSELRSGFDGVTELFDRAANDQLSRKDCKRMYAIGQWLRKKNK